MTNNDYLKKIINYRTPRRRADRPETIGSPYRRIDPVAYAAALEVLG